MAKSNIKPIEAGVSQGSILGPHLCPLFTSDIPTLPEIGLLTATFSDDIALASPHEDLHDVAVNNLHAIADDINA